jgi:TonB family protein
MEVQNADFLLEHRELCFDKASHELLSVDSKAPRDDKYSEWFSSYISFDESWYPKNFTFQKSGGERISASVVTLNGIAFDPALLAPPKGAIERRKCPGIKPPFAVKKVSPILDQESSQGQATASITVLSDGSVGDVEIMSASSSAMEKASLEAFKKFGFTPAMCGAEPVVTDLEISVSVKRD